jgi:acyl carrier protein phosphodiesterase
MNFLAHLYLSPKNEEIMFGNFIADSVKGKVFDTYSEKIQQGILLHREIDQYIDSHPVFKESKKRLSPRYRMYSGVITDIFYDHFLAKNWSEYSDKELSRFVSSAYQMLIKKFLLLPARSKRTLPFMIAQNWLVNYANFKDLRKVFRGMSRRTSNTSPMLNAVDDLELHYELFEAEFRAFFPDIILHIHNSNFYKNIVPKVC